MRFSFFACSGLFCGHSPIHDSPPSCLAYLAARLRDRKAAESNAAQALALSPGNIEVSRMVALTYEALRERDRTLALIQEAPDWLLSRLNRHPDLADLQKDSRFQQLIASHHVQ